MIAPQAKRPAPDLFCCVLSSPEKREPANNLRTDVFQGLRNSIGRTSDAQLSQFPSRNRRGFCLRALLRIGRRRPRAGLACVGRRRRRRRRRWWRGSRRRSRRGRGRGSRRGRRRGWRRRGRSRRRRRSRSGRWRWRRSGRRRRGRGLSPGPERASGAGSLGSHDLQSRHGLGYEAQEVPDQAQRRAARSGHDRIRLCARESGPLPGGNRRARSPRQSEHAPRAELSRLRDPQARPYRRRNQRITSSRWRSTPPIRRCGNISAKPM